MSVFKFKQFDLEQSRSAQKLGTDAVLLGAWCCKDQKPYSILDVGTGTGVIALMLAQRFSRAEIEGIELYDNAYEEATANFENSPWNDRLFCYHASFQEFYSQDEEDLDKYDLIVSNPPFFDHKSLGEEVRQDRSVARFDAALPFDELIYGAYKLLHREGTFACIIPSDREQEFTEIANHFTLEPTRVTYVKGTEDSKVKRCLMEFRFRESEITKLPTEINTLVLEEKRHQYTPEVNELFKDFYLKL